MLTNKPTLLSLHDPDKPQELGACRSNHISYTELRIIKPMFLAHADSGPYSNRISHKLLDTIYMFQTPSSYESFTA